MSMIEAAISRLESLAAACEDNAAIEANEGKSELADNNLRNAASYREAIRRLQAPEEQAPEQPPQIPQRTPQIGDQVVYHPRPIDRVRKPENYNGLVSHTAFVAHAHDQIFLQPDGHRQRRCAVPGQQHHIPPARVQHLR